jgi:hypothetical protein
MILLDTNLLTRMTRSRDPQSCVAHMAIQTLSGPGERLIVVPRNLYDFWAVATRPPGPPPAGSNGLGMTPAQAAPWLRFYQRRFTLFPDREELTRLWQAPAGVPITSSSLESGTAGIAGYRRAPLKTSRRLFHRGSNNTSMSLPNKPPIYETNRP